MPKRYRVRIARRAEQDIEEIYDYISQDNPRAAGDFVIELENQVSSLDRHPLRCPLIPEAAEWHVPYRHLVHGEYRTIFRIAGSSVFILRVIHGARLLDMSILASP